MNVFALGDRITVRTKHGQQATGRVVEILHPEDGIPGSRREGGPTPFNSYSGGYCQQHKRPAPPYAGAPHVAPTLPHYTILTGKGDGIERCECQVIDDSKAVELW